VRCVSLSLAGDQAAGAPDVTSDLRRARGSLPSRAGVLEKCSSALRALLSRGRGGVGGV
jgi:hypothetical protein